MADEETIPQQDPSTLNSESSMTSINDQSRMLGGTVQSVSVPSAIEANSRGPEIHPVDVASSNDATVPNVTADDSHGVGIVQEDEQQPTEDVPSIPLIAPRYEPEVPRRIAPTYGMSFPIRFVDYGTYEPPPPPRPSWIQCMCCCFLTAYYFHYARKIRNSKYMPRVLVVLLLIPFSAIYFGLRHVTLCPLASFSPILVAFSGLLGIFLILARGKAISERMEGIEKPSTSAATSLTIMLMILMTIDYCQVYKLKELNNLETVIIMADEETTPKQAPLSLDSEIFEESSTTSINDQPSMLDGTVQRVSIPSATEANSPGAEIHPIDVASSDDATLPNVTFSSTADDSHGVGAVQVDEQQPTEDDPSIPFLPTYAMGFPIRFVDYGTYEPPPPPQPSWIQCICCCFLTAYYFHYAKKIRNSKYILLVLTALLVIPCSAVYFGFAYVGFCNLAPASPPIVAVMGFLGIGLISFRMLAMSRRIWDISLCKDVDTQMGVVGVTIMLMVIAIFVTHSFYTNYPNFYDPEDAVYCEKTYYYYVLCINLIVLIVGIIGLLLHIPMKPRDPVQVVPLEYYETI